MTVRLTTSIALDVPSVQPHCMLAPSTAFVQRELETWRAMVRESGGDGGVGRERASGPMSSVRQHGNPRLYLSPRSTYE